MINLFEIKPQQDAILNLNFVILCSVFFLFLFRCCYMPIVCRIYWCNSVYLSSVRCGRLRGLNYDVLSQRIMNMQPRRGGGRMTGTRLRARVCRLRACVRMCVLTATSHLSSALFGRDTDTLLGTRVHPKQRSEAHKRASGMRAHTVTSAKSRARPTNFPKTPINQPPFAMHYLPVRRKNSPMAAHEPPPPAHCSPSTAERNTVHPH